MDLKEKIRIVPDFPKEGIQFIDITTILKDGQAFSYVIDSLVNMAREVRPDIVVGPEARGFTVGAPIAYGLEAGKTARRDRQLPVRAGVRHRHP